MQHEEEEDEILEYNSPSSDEESDQSFPEVETARNDGDIPS